MAPGEELAQAGPRPGATPAKVDPRALPPVPDLLAAAVAGIGGAERPGQVAMAEAVERSLQSGEHLAVQAGTGTGKSLAYLVPAVAHALASGAPVVVATATIALQRQLIDRDLPRLSDDAGKPLLGQDTGVRDPEGPPQLSVPVPAEVRRARGARRHAVRAEARVSAVGQQVQRVTRWAAAPRPGTATNWCPGVDDRAWRQVSVTAPECIGAQRCPFGSRTATRSRPG